MDVSPEEFANLKTTMGSDGVYNIQPSDYEDFGGGPVGDFLGLPGLAELQGGMDLFRTPAEDWARLQANMSPFWSARAPMQDFASRALGRYYLQAPNIAPGEQTPTFADFMGRYVGGEAGGYERADMETLLERAREAAMAARDTGWATRTDDAIEANRRRQIAETFGPEAQNQVANNLAVAQMFGVQLPGGGAQMGRSGDAIRRAIQREQQRYFALGGDRGSFLDYYLGKYHPAAAANLAAVAQQSILNPVPTNPWGSTSAVHGDALGIDPQIIQAGIDAEAARQAEAAELNAIGAQNAVNQINAANAANAANVGTGGGTGTGVGTGVGTDANVIANVIANANTAPSISPDPWGATPRVHGFTSIVDPQMQAELNQAGISTPISTGTGGTATTTPGTVWGNTSIVDPQLLAEQADAIANQRGKEYWAQQELERAKAKKAADAAAYIAAQQAAITKGMPYANAGTVWGGGEEQVVPFQGVEQVKSFSQFAPGSKDDAWVQAALAAKVADAAKASQAYSKVGYTPTRQATTPIVRWEDRVYPDTPGWQALQKKLKAGMGGTSTLKTALELEKLRSGGIR